MAYNIKIVNQYRTKKPSHPLPPVYTHESSSIQSWGQHVKHMHEIKSTNQLVGWASKDIKTVVGAKQHHGEVHLDWLNKGITA